MQTTYLQDRLIDYAAHHFCDAVARAEGDVAVFCDCRMQRADGTCRTACQVVVVDTMVALRALLVH